MTKWIAKVQQLWERPSSVSSIPFSIPCACGKTVTGERQATHQVVTCPSCQSELFVLPISPLPPPGPLSTIDATGKPVSRSARRSKIQHTLVMLSYVLLSLVMVSIVVLAFLLFTYPQTPPIVPTPKHRLPLSEAQKKRLANHREKMEEAFSQGHFSVALRHLGDIMALQPIPTFEEEQRLLLLRRELLLYADLLENSLEEILEHAITLPESEWYGNFESRYRGKTVIFDTTVRREADEKVAASYLVQVQGEEVKLDLERTGLFDNKLLQEPERVLFGARLNNIERIAPESWVVQFQNESGVLLTLAEAAAISCPALADPDAREIIDRQKKEVYLIKP